MPLREGCHLTVDVASGPRSEGGRARATAPLTAAAATCTSDGDQCRRRRCLVLGLQAASRGTAPEDGGSPGGLPVAAARRLQRPRLPTGASSMKQKGGHPARYFHQESAPPSSPPLLPPPPPSLLDALRRSAPRAATHWAPGASRNRIPGSGPSSQSPALLITTRRLCR